MYRKGYLADFMKQHEKEVNDKMSELFDEEVMREQYNIAENKKAKEEGRVEGKAEGLLEALSKLIANGMPENEAKKILGLA